MPLQNAIHNYYFEHLDALPFEKQFHLATRLSAWSKDNQAQQLLRDLRPAYVGDQSQLEASLRTLLHSPSAAVANAADLRAPYFERYPSLRGIDFALFRMRHLEAAYGLNTRAELLACVTRSELTALEQQLWSDEPALRILSTYAINLFYLFRRVLEHDDSAAAINLRKLYDLADAYNPANAHHLQLLIYLYTHCIIGESNFYVRHISPVHLPMYLAMLARLDTLIAQHYDRINLDNKLEFLVCCRLCQYDTELFARIYQECEHSLSDEGTFLVDRHNSHQQSDKISLAQSEHRNVLFMMSTLPFDPQPMPLDN